MIGLILNYLPWGIRLEPIAISLSLFVISFATLAAARKYMRLRENENRQFRDELQATKARLGAMESNMANNTRQGDESLRKAREAIVSAS